ncbi:MAG TPA: MFS transporter [Terriglobales bacterium]|nr:MFS transporter [Terriglobales bacterium]
MKSAARVAQDTKEPRIFYGWYIVAVGFLSNVASSFALASTLSIFLKPLTAELGVSRGVFSLLRSGEGIIGACLAPLVGMLVDRHGGARLMAVGTTLVGVGYLFLGHIDTFAQFVLIRLVLVTVGDALMGSSVVNIVIAQWFVRQRGRALAFSSMGIGFAKVCMPVIGAWLIVTLGWRHTWMVFGLSAIVLGVAPALLFVRKSPEHMGLQPDGGPAVAVGGQPSGARSKPVLRRSAPIHDDVAWTPREALGTSAFWLLAITFGIASIGVTGLNLHIYSYVTDVGYPPVIAGSVMSVIASMQLASPLAWGFLTERIDARYAATLRFIVQGIGLSLAILSGNLICLYCGFFLYGIGLGGNMVLPDILWASYFGRRSLGKIRGMGIFISQVLAAVGPPFFGFLFDITGGYGLSFAIFGIVLMISAILSLMLRQPRKMDRSDGVLE